MERLSRATGIRQAVILAGGIGSRLRPLTFEVPKPMVTVNNRPFLDYLLEMLKENGISEVVILLGYLPERITQYYGDGSKFGVAIKYSIGDISLKTGERIKNAEGLLNDIFLLMYCDNYWPLDMNRLIDFYTKYKTLALVTVYTNKDRITTNNILVDERGYVIKYDRSRKGDNLNGVEIGFFLINKKVLEIMPCGDFSFEEEIIPRLIAKRQLCGYQTDHRYYSISTPERLKLTEKFLQTKKVVFLDRDGVINKKPPKANYVRSWGEFEFLPGAIQALKLLTQNRYDIYIITNQAGIARGLMTEQSLEDIHENFKKELVKHNAKITAIYYCPHGWDDGCECRKPKPGMFFQAAREHDLDLTKAIYIGDDERDLQTGEAAGCKTIIVTPENDLLQTVISFLNSRPEPMCVNYETLLDSLLKAQSKSNKTRYLVLIGGCAQSGKTTLSKLIQNDLQKRGIECLIIPLDNWLLGLDERKGDETVRERFQYRKISKALNRIKEGTKVYTPLYDPRSRSIIDKKAQKLYIYEGIIIVDGVVALDIKELRNISDFKIFVDIADRTRKERLKLFYGDYKNIPPDEAKSIIESRELEEVPVIKKTRAHADVIFRDTV